MTFITEIEEILQKLMKDDYLELKECQMATSDEVTSKKEKFKCKILTKGKEMSKTLIFYPHPNSDLKKLKAWAECTQLLDEILSNVSNDVCHVIQKTFIFFDKIPYLIWEDLEAQQFKLASLTDPNGLDLGKSTEVVKSLAAFHAASIALLQSKPNSKKEMKDVIVSEKINITKIYEKISKIIEADDLSGEKWSEKLKMIKDTLEEKVKAEWYSNECTTLSVMGLQGVDLSNLMLRYRGCGTWDAHFVTLNPPQLSTPVLDLIWFIQGCIKNDVKFQVINIILETYHSRFTTLCQLLNVPHTSNMEIFRKEIEEKSTIAFVLFCALNGPNTEETFDQKYFSQGMKYFEEIGVFK